MTTYSSKLQIIDNRVPSLHTFVAYSNPTKRIVVTKVTNGTERQQEWANNLKTEALQAIDKTAYTLIGRGANQDKTVEWRNRLMEIVDGDVDANSVINHLKDASFSAEKITVTYGIKP